MIYRCQKYGSDTCGGSWPIDNELFLEADTLEAAIKHVCQQLHIPEQITAYTLRTEEEVRSIRTPRGSGHGVWERNPDFDPKFHLAAGDITEIKLACGLGCVTLNEITTVSVK